MTDTTPHEPDHVYDVVVIGAGIVGSAIARDLSGHQLSVALVEARDDVGDGTSKANTAILHTGFDAKPGTLESGLVKRGYHLLSEYARSTGIPVEHTGAILVAWNAEELDALPGLKVKAEQNGYDRCRIVGADEVYEQIPSLGEERSADSRSPTSRSSAPGPRTWRWPPTRGSAAPRSCSTTPSPRCR